jgi:hypothetical protein
MKLTGSCPKKFVVTQVVSEQLADCASNGVLGRSALVSFRVRHKTEGLNFTLRIIKDAAVMTTLNC